MTAKRGARFLGKRAQETHESMWVIAEMTFFALFLVLLLMFVKGVEKDTTFEKNYYAKDFSLAIDSAYASPQQLYYRSPNNLTKYDVRFDSHYSRLSDNKDNSKNSERRYWYTDERDAQFSVPDPIINAEFIIFKKKAGANLQLLQQELPIEAQK